MEERKIVVCVFKKNEKTSVRYQQLFDEKNRVVRAEKEKK